jgi:hypothetical protein
MMTNECQARGANPGVLTLYATHTKRTGGEGGPGFEGGYLLSTRHRGEMLIDTREETVMRAP